MHLAFQLLQVNMLCCHDFQINRLHYCRCICTSMHTGLPYLHKENNSNLFFLEMPHFASFLFSLDCFAYQTCPTQMTNMTLVQMPPVRWTRTLKSIKSFLLTCFNEFSDFISHFIFARLYL